MVSEWPGGERSGSQTRTSFLSPQLHWERGAVWQWHGLFWKQYPKKLLLWIDWLQIGKMLTSRTFLLCYFCKSDSRECGTFKLHFGPIIAEGFTYVLCIWDKWSGLVNTVVQSGSCGKRWSHASWVYIGLCSRKGETVPFRPWPRPLKVPISNLWMSVSSPGSGKVFSSF